MKAVLSPGQNLVTKREISQGDTTLCALAREANRVLGRQRNNQNIMRRKYTDTDRAKATNNRLVHALSRIGTDYPQDREPGRIIQRQNGQEMIVDLIPWGRCDQWRAVFPDGTEVRGGMDKIHAEIRGRMPPRKGL